MKRFVDMAAKGWWSGDLDARRPAKDLELLMEADDLHVVELITWPGRQDSCWPRPPASAKDPLVRFDENRYYHLSAGVDARAGGTLLFFNLAQAARHGRPGREYPPQAGPDPAGQVSTPAPGSMPRLPTAGTCRCGSPLGNVDSIELANSNLARKSCRDQGRSPASPATPSAFPGPTATAAGRRESTTNCSIAGCAFRPPPAAARAWPPIRSVTTGFTPTSTAISATRNGGTPCGRPRRP